MTFCADYPRLGHVHNEVGKCSCGHVALLECEVCGAEITASEYDRGMRCDRHGSPVFREAFLTGRRLLEDSDLWRLA